MNQDVFSYRDYKQYLKARLLTSGQTWGIRSRLAKALRCQSAFVSQVINGETHFSLEHAVVVSEFLGHTEDESQYFLLLVHLARAGSITLARYYENQMKALLSKRQQIKERIRVREGLTPVDQTRYYSSWQYSAIHIGLAVPGLQTSERIATHFGIPKNKVIEILDFLASCGLAVHKGNEYSLGQQRIHLDSNSALISKHHANWRLKAIQAMDASKPEDLRYSGVLALSRSDREQIRGILLNAIESSEKILQQTEEEGLFAISMDFYEI